jgi:hypothetical protein
MRALVTCMARQPPKHTISISVREFSFDSLIPNIELLVFLQTQLYHLTTKQSSPLLPLNQNQHPPQLPDPVQHIKPLPPSQQPHPTNPASTKPPPPPHSPKTLLPPPPPTLTGPTPHISTLAQLTVFQQASDQHTSRSPYRRACGPRTPWVLDALPPTAASRLLPRRGRK